MLEKVKRYHLLSMNLNVRNLFFIGQMFHKAGPLVCSYMNHDDHACAATAQVAGTSHECREEYSHCCYVYSSPLLLFYTPTTQHWSKCEGTSQEDACCCVYTLRVLLRQLRLPAGRPATRGRYRTQVRVVLIARLAIHGITLNSTRDNTNCFSASGNLGPLLFTEKL